MQVRRIQIFATKSAVQCILTFCNKKCHTSTSIPVNQCTNAPVPVHCRLLHGKSGEFCCFEQSALFHIQKSNLTVEQDPIWSKRIIVRMIPIMMRWQWCWAQPWEWSGVHTTVVKRALCKPYPYFHYPTMLCRPSPYFHYPCHTSTTLAIHCYADTPYSAMQNRPAVPYNAILHIVDAARRNHGDRGGSGVGLFG